MLQVQGPHLEPLLGMCTLLDSEAHLNVPTKVHLLSTSKYKLKVFTGQPYM